MRGHSYAILAMADWQLGKTNEARAMLGEGNKLDPNIMPATIADDPTDRWRNWLYARTQLDEAAALIQPGSKAAGLKSAQ